MGTPQGAVASPLLANIYLHYVFDLWAHQWRRREATGNVVFVRYADDIVVLCRSDRQAQEARTVVEQFLTNRLSLQLSDEKTKVTTFKQGFSFLGFDLKSQSCCMRAKSVEKFKTRVKELTIRSRNLDAKVIADLNAVVRGVSRYFVTPFSTVADQFRTLDRWVRMRLRAMKYKRKSVEDNWRLRIAHLKRMGLIFLSDSLMPQRC